MFLLLFSVWLSAAFVALAFHTTTPSILWLRLQSMCLQLTCKRRVFFPVWPPPSPATLFASQASGLSILRSVAHVVRRVLFRWYHYCRTPCQTASDYSTGPYQPGDPVADPGIVLNSRFWQTPAKAGFSLLACFGRIGIGRAPTLEKAQIDVQIGGVDQKVLYMG